MRSFFRETLTIIACIIVASLALATIIPALWSWENSRDWLDKTLSEAIHFPVKTTGALNLRLLPSIKLEVAHILIGSDDKNTEQPAHMHTAKLDGVSIDIALLPLLKKQLRFDNISIENFDVHTLMDENGKLTAPSIAANQEKDLQTASVWQIAFDNMQLKNGRLRLHDIKNDTQTVIDPIRIQANAPSHRGPWRIRGEAKNIAFELNTGEQDNLENLPFKLIMGGSSAPRFEFDGQLTSLSNAPKLDGKLKIQAGPPVQPSDSTWAIPTTLTAKITSTERGLSILGIEIEAGEGFSALKSKGEGALIFGSPAQLNIALDAPRLDVDAFWLSPAGSVLVQMLNRPKNNDPIAHANNAAPASDIPLKAKINLTSKQIWAGGEVLENAAAQLQFNKGILALYHFEATPPGGGKTMFQGVGEGGEEARVKGKLSIISDKPNKLSSWLRLFSLPTGLLDLSLSKPLEMQADVYVNKGTHIISNLNWRSGSNAISGNLKRQLTNKSEDNLPPRALVIAKVMAKGFDISRIPTLPALLQNVGESDLDLTLDAEELQLTPDKQLNNMQAVTTGKWHMSIKNRSNGIAIEKLTITDLGTLNATLSGYLSPRGDGSMTGTIEARHLEPLSILMTKLTGQEHLRDWIPEAMREAPLKGKLEMTTRPALEIPQPEWKSSQKETLGNPAYFMPVYVKVSGAVKDVDMALNLHALWNEKNASPILKQATLSLETEQQAHLFELLGIRAGQLLTSNGGANIALDVTRTVDRPLSLNIKAKFANATLETTKPIPLRLGVKADDAGVVHLKIDEKSAQAIDIVARTGFESSHIWLEPKGTLFSEAFEGNIGFDPKDRIYWGELKTGSLSLPALAFPLGLGQLNTAGDGRFEPPLTIPISGDIVVYAQQLTLTPSYTAQNARITFALNPERLVLKDIVAQIEGTDLKGTLTLKHQSGRGNLAGNLTVADAQALSPALKNMIGGRLETTIALGASGETLGAMLANLNGNGEVIWNAPTLPYLAPSAPFETAQWALAQRDPPNQSAENTAKLAQKTSTLFNANTFSNDKDSSSNIAINLSGGLLKAGSFALDNTFAKATGNISYDMKQGLLSARIDVQSMRSPAGWSGQPPLASVVWKGTLSQTQREVNVDNLVESVAASRVKRSQNDAIIQLPKPPQRPLDLQVQPTPE